MSLSLVHMHEGLVWFPAVAWIVESIPTTVKRQGGSSIVVAVMSKDRLNDELLLVVLSVCQRIGADRIVDESDMCGDWYVRWSACLSLVLKRYGYVWWSACLTLVLKYDYNCFWTVKQKLYKTTYTESTAMWRAANYITRCIIRAIYVLKSSSTVR